MSEEPYDPVKCLREEVDRFKSTNRFTPHPNATMKIINQPINESFIEDYEALKLHLKKSELRYEQLVNYLTAKLGTKGEHGVFETIDNVTAEIMYLKAQLSAAKEELARWRNQVSASPVTDNPNEHT